MNDLFNELIDKVKDFYFKCLTTVKSKLLGENNEKLDFILDSFYKLSPKEKNKVFLIAIGSSLFLFILLLTMYFSGIKRLDNNITSRFEALNKLSSLKTVYSQEKSKYDALIDNINTKALSLRPKPFFEQLSKGAGIYINGLRENKVTIPPDNPLYGIFDYLDVEMEVSSRLSSSRNFDSAISLPKLLNFISEVEKSDNFFRVKDLSIRSILGDKLYFNVRISFRTYVPAGASL